MHISTFRVSTRRQRRQGARQPFFIVLLAIFAMIAVGCAAPPRPTLVTAPGATPEAATLQLDLAPAPDTVAPLPPASPDLALESSVDDALLAWSIERNIAYLDGCARVTPQPEMLCDSPTSEDTVRLLGPSSDNIWYVVRVNEVSSFDLGTGYRVGDVQIAGR